MPRAVAPSLDPELPVQRVVSADVGAPPPAGTLPSRIFYSTVRELYIGVSPGRLETLSNGTVERLGEKFVRFMPMGDLYGIFKTDDPEIIANLEKRMRDAREAGIESDVLTEQEYDARHMTDDVKLQISQRKIEEQNRLILEQTRQNQALLEELERYRQSRGEQ